MHLSWVRCFSTTGVNLAKRSAKKTIKGKADIVLVQCDSVVSGHRSYKRRGRLEDKLEFVEFDPIIQMNALYREQAKVRSIQEIYEVQFNTPSPIRLPDDTFIAELEDTEKKLKS